MLLELIHGQMYDMLVPCMYAYYALIYVGISLIQSFATSVYFYFALFAKMYCVRVCARENI